MITYKVSSFYCSYYTLWFLNSFPRGRCAGEGGEGHQLLSGKPLHFLVCKLSPRLQAEVPASEYLISIWWTRKTRRGALNSCPSSTFRTQTSVYFKCGGLQDSIWARQPNLWKKKQRTKKEDMRFMNICAFTLLSCSTPWHSSNMKGH